MHASSTSAMGAGHTRCGCDGQHEMHAGSVCQAAGICSTPLVPPAHPAPDRSLVVAAEPGSVLSHAEAGRGPPSLAALQLLRI
ncbi:DUF6153 family protein [Kitasatospora sp. NPDC098652]|uniref:DUF6153 family protein n=1 Tax=Kitasatospora sp. NPDC098652 TaxID=3364095 RepID=UPI0038155D41